MGCGFHFKQAARGKMENLGIPADEIKIAMRFGVYDLLVALPKDELASKGVDFVRSMIIKLVADEIDPGGEWEKRWDEFWEYFK